jgi:hypothetical protein
MRPSIESQGCLVIQPTILTTPALRLLSSCLHTSLQGACAPASVAGGRLSGQEAGMFHREAATTKHVIFHMQDHRVCNILADVIEQQLTIVMYGLANP